MRILLDCDGVLADFVGACLETIYKHTGVCHTHDEVTKWDLFEALGKPELRPVLEKAWTTEGWCFDIPVKSGAKEAVERLRECGEVIVCTSPMAKPYWAYERAVWLLKHFDFDEKNIILTESKECIRGDVLIDDSAKQCLMWERENRDKLTLLWDAPHNQNAHLAGSSIRRVKGWDEVMECVGYGAPMAELKWRGGEPTESEWIETLTRYGWIQNGVLRTRR